MIHPVPHGASERLKASVRDVPDFPQKGVLFRDITPILKDGQLFRLAISLLADRYRTCPVDAIVAIDARGFLFGGALAYCLGTGVVVVRKKGKLPCKTVSKSYDLEYGKNTIEMHSDSIHKGDKVVIIDDVLATGGTVAATIDLVRQLGGEILEVAVLIELNFLNGREKLMPLPVFSAIQY
ncbi:MAG: adenine phosphoribosyltransferase [bacterium]